MPSVTPRDWTNISVGGIIDAQKEAMKLVDPIAAKPASDS
jgi:hypothetical protein